MKVKLLKKLRERGRNMVDIHSLTTSDGITIGMSYGYDYDEYRGLFQMGDTEKSVKEKAARVYIKTNIDDIRKQYCKK